MQCSVSGNIVNAYITATTFCSLRDSVSQQTFGTTAIEMDHTIRIKKKTILKAFPQLIALPTGV